MKWKEILKEAGKEELEEVFKEIIDAVTTLQKLTDPLYEAMDTDDIQLSKEVFANMVPYLSRYINAHGAFVSNLELLQYQIFGDNV